MSINSVSNTTTASVYDESSKKAVQTNTQAAQSTDKSEVTDAAVYEKSSGTSSVADEKKIQSMLEECNQKTESLRKLIESLFNKQSSKSAIAGKNSSSSGVSSFTMPDSNLKEFFSNLEVDEATRLKAQEEISEDGYYGVKQTSERILDFAMAIAGNDPEKIAEMREAVQKGFDKAEQMWGGELPEICQKTYDTVMAGFDKWEKEANGITEE